MSAVSRDDAHWARLRPALVEDFRRREAKRVEGPLRGPRFSVVLNDWLADIRSGSRVYVDAEPELVEYVEWFVAKMRADCLTREAWK